MMESFSWPLALGLVGSGAAAALLVHFLRVDFDRHGFIESADDLRISFETQGHGPPLVALAGGPGMSHHGFHPYLRPLTDRATVIYVDLRGRGESDEADGYRVADDVRDLQSLRRSLGLSPMALLGVSYGAHLAVAYTLEHPAAVHKLILVSPIVGRSAWEAHLQTLLSAPGMEETLSAIKKRHGDVLLSHRASGREIVRTLAPLYWCDPADRRPRASVFRPWHRIARQNFEVYESIVGRPFGFLNGDLKDARIESRLSEIEAPALLIQGACDGVVPEDHVRWLESTLPNAQRLLLPESGHTPFLDQPLLFVEHVRRFLAEPDSPPPAS
jgi:proline iminopeptidase